MTVRASPFVVALLLCCGSSMSSAGNECQSVSSKCSVAQNLATRFAIKRTLKWESPGDWVPHTPYQAEQWYYYFRPYQGTDYGKIKPIAYEALPARPYSVNVFERVYESIQLNEDKASPSDDVQYSYDEIRFLNRRD